MPVSKHDPRLRQVGFAKLQGDDGQDYYFQKYEIFLGRRSKSTDLDIVLGDNMNISRKHAKITFNFQKGVFELIVMGKNGVTVQGVLYTPTSEPLALQTRDYMQIGDRAFYFLLPKTGTAATGPPTKKQKISKPKVNGTVVATMPAGQAAPMIHEQEAARPMPYANTTHEPQFRSEIPAPMAHQANERLEDPGHQGPYQPHTTTGGTEYYDDEEYDDAEENFAADETGQYEEVEEDSEDDDDAPEDEQGYYQQNYNQRPGL